YLQGLITELRHLRVHLYGGYWDRHPLLRTYHRGNALGRHYRLAVSQAKIAINLVRHANRDGHVMRSFELPACGGFMLCERTEEHARLFKENTEAAFFSSSGDLIEKVAHFVNREAERTEIARAGHRKITSERHTYRDRFSQIL